MSYRPLRSLTTPGEFENLVQDLGVAIPFDPVVEPAPSGPLSRSVDIGGFRVGNRFCILPLEGWDSDEDGNPTDISLERWRRLGRSGAKLIWGESAAVRPDGRSSPQQLLVDRNTLPGLEMLRLAAVEAHRQAHGDPADFKVGLQLTHSGRYSKPHGMSSPVSVRHHPYLDRTVGPPPDQPLIGDDEIYALIETYVTAVGLVAEAGFDFVDLKACHGYLGHELLGAFERPGNFGGSFENRVRFLTTIVSGAKSAVPDIRLALRLSAFDTVTHVADEDGVGRPITEDDYRYWFGTDETGHTIDLAEPVRLLTMMHDMGVNPVCITGSSPYNARHLQRPALNVSPGEYLPPEDPLVGVARHLDVTRRLNQAVPGLVVVGSGYSYLQQWMSNVAQAVVRSGAADIVGLGRLHLASPTVPSDVLSGRGLDTEKIWASF